MPKVHGKGAATAPKKGIILRLIKDIFHEYGGLLILQIVCIAIFSIVSVIPAVYVKNIVAIMETGLLRIKEYGFTDAAGYKQVFAEITPTLLKALLAMACVYLVGLLTAFTYTRLGAVITQGYLCRLREKMFSGMQDLPVKYFDTHFHGDVMSYYTNDTDTLRQLISQSLPTIVQAVLILTGLIGIMLWYSVWMTLVVMLGVAAMTVIAKKVGGGSAKYFIKQQVSMGKVEGFAEEMMNGQKVVKAFCHEREAIADFDKLNDQLRSDATSAHNYANILMPIMGNIGNIMYVLAAFAGGILILNKVFNPSISGVVTGDFTLGIPVVVSFLGMTRQFCANVSQVSQQINSIVMARAGATRIFELIDTEPETDNGYVTLVNAKEKDGKIEETPEHTGLWAWKHPHGDGTVTYTRLEGDIVFDHVDFGYTEEKTVLHDVTLYARPGQKIALVGATGAGKTTITNLINRFYDIADGKIRYDNININKIKKADLRRSLGIVLQDVNLFTGTVMENIRYGRPNATDEDCVAAAKLANADSFIRMLPEGYDTLLRGDGSGLSQGQRQLISIARAAIADPPVMILDEATSSIDTRTEAIVQKGMDALMKGRTVFVIAHRLSTVKNSDVIMVLDHGRIIERGSHEKLIEEKGTYYRLYTGAFELE